MKKSVVALLLLFVVAAVLTSLAYSEKQKADVDAVAAITKLENDAVKADLANEAGFYEKLLADDWTGGTSRGTWDTKKSLLQDMKDTKNNSTKSEAISDLKVRTYGDTAIATYKSAYDSMIQGKHYARTVLTTDTFQRQNGVWKQIASHSSKQSGE